LVTRERETRSHGFQFQTLAVFPTPHISSNHLHPKLQASIAEASIAFILLHRLPSQIFASSFIAEASLSQFSLSNSSAAPVLQSKFSSQSQI